MTGREMQARIAEYEEAGRTRRYANTLLFGQLSVYLGANAVVWNAYMTETQSKWTLLLSFLSKDQSDWTLLVLTGAGVLLSVIFSVIGERAGDFLHGAKDRMRDLERHLWFRLASDHPSAVVWSATNATRLTFLVPGLVWLILMILELRASQDGCLSWVMVLILGALWGVIAVILAANAIRYGQRELERRRRVQLMFARR